MDELRELAAVQAFLSRFAADRAAGARHEVAHYVAQFPEHRAAIEREHAALLEPSATSVAPASTAPAATAAGQVLRIGRYEVVRELGRGGQAVVYLARDGQLQRDVALKVLPRVRSSLEQELRLQREALTAARLEDSGICPIYEVGHDGAHAFLAMRFVAGQTLANCIAAARARGGPPAPVLPWPELLGVFERLCRSLHRAHEAGVVHRDLKPGNVMLGEDGAPVLLDFGLAADLESEGPLLTRSGDVFGTPGYLPPERLRDRTRSDDRRGDLWSMGVSLYEAATGQRPFTAPTLDALYRAILTDEPTPARRLAPALPRDLDHVLAVCLDKQPERRYQTALDLADDLRAVRLGEPIRARPPSAWRRVQRWHRRHAALATALWLVLLGLGVVIAQQRASLREVGAARDEAQRVNDFLVEKLLLGVTPSEARGRDLTVAEIFDRAGANIAASFPAASRTAGQLHHVLGRAYRQLGRRDAARAAFERAVAIRSEVLGAEARETLASRRELAAARRERDDLEGALAELRSVLRLQEQRYGTVDDDAMATRRELAELLLALGRHTEAEQEARAVVAAREAIRPPDAPDLLAARHWLARCLVAQGRRAEAEPIVRDVLAGRRRALGPDAIEVEQSLVDLASLLHDRAVLDRVESKWQDAEQVYAEHAALAQKLYPKSNPGYATTVNNLAMFWADRSERAADAVERERYLDRAEALYRESLALRETVDGAVSARVATACSNLASLLSVRQRHDDALALLDRAQAIHERLSGPAHPDVLKQLNNRAVVTSSHRGVSAALPLFVEAKTRAAANPDIDPTLRLIIENGWVVALCRSGDAAAALAAIEDFYPRAAQLWGAGDREVRATAQRAASACRALGLDPAVWEDRAKGGSAPR